MALYVDPDGNSRDLDAEQSRFAARGWKFRVRYDAGEPTYLAVARKAWTLHFCSANGDNEDEARAAVLDLMAENYPIRT